MHTSARTHARKHTLTHRHTLIDYSHRTYLDHVEFIILRLGAEQNLLDYQLLASCIILIGNNIPGDSVVFTGEGDACEFIRILLVD